MEGLNSSWVRMMKLLRALQAQADEVNQRVAEVEASFANSLPAPIIVRQQQQAAVQHTSSPSLTTGELDPEALDRPHSTGPGNNVRGKDDDIHIIAAVSIAHKDGLSYDEHSLVVPFNSTSDRVKSTIFQAVPQLHENRLDEFFLSVAGEELTVEFHRFSDFHAVRKAILAKVPVLVELQAKDSKKKRSTKKKEKRKGSKLPFPIGFKGGAGKNTPTYERIARPGGDDGDDRDDDQDSRNRRHGQEKNKKPTKTDSNAATPVHERSRGSEQSVGMSVVMAVTAEAEDHRLANKASSGSSASAVERRDPREMRANSDVGSDSNSGRGGNSPGGASIPTVLVSNDSRPNKHGSHHNYKPARPAVRHAKSRSTSGTKEAEEIIAVQTNQSKGGRGGSAEVSPRSASGDTEERAHSFWDARRSEPLNESELQALRDLVDLTAEKTDKEAEKKKKITGASSKRKNKAASSSANKTLWLEDEPLHRRAVVDIAANNSESVMADECQSLKHLLGVLDPSAVDLDVELVPLPSPVMGNKSKSKRKSKEEKEEGRRGITFHGISTNSGHREEEKHEGVKENDVDKKLKGLAEREKKLINWEEQLFKEGLESEEEHARRELKVKAAEEKHAERELDLRQKEMAANTKETTLVQWEQEVEAKAKWVAEMKEELERRELEFSTRESSIEALIIQREQEIEQRLVVKVEEEVRRRFEAQLHLLIDWEKRLQKQEHEIPAKEVVPPCLTKNMAGFGADACPGPI